MSFNRSLVDRLTEKESNRFNAKVSHKFTKNCLGRFYENTSIDGATASEERKQKTKKKKEMLLSVQNEKLKVEIDKLEMAQKKALRMQQREQQRIVAQSMLAAIKVQSEWRRYRARNEYQKKMAGKTLASYGKVWKEMKSYRLLRNACREKRHREESAVKIQKLVLVKLHREQFKRYRDSMCTASLVVQKLWRGQLARNVLEQLKMQQRLEMIKYEATVKIQQTFRGYAIRMAKQEVVYLVTAAQAVIRGYLARRSVEVMKRERVERTMMRLEMKKAEKMKRKVEVEVVDVKDRPEWKAAGVHSKMKMEVKKETQQDEQVNSHERRRILFRKKMERKKLERIEMEKREMKMAMEREMKWMEREDRAMRVLRKLSIQRAMKKEQESIPVATVEKQETSISIDKEERQQQMQAMKEKFQKNQAKMLHQRRLQQLQKQEMKLMNIEDRAEKLRIKQLARIKQEKAEKRKNRKLLQAAAVSDKSVRAFLNRQSKNDSVLPAIPKRKHKKEKKRLRNNDTRIEDDFLPQLEDNDFEELVDESELRLMKTSNLRLDIF